MAKKTTAKKRSKETEGIWDSVSTFFTKERVRFSVGLIIIILVIYVGIALISFFFTGGADQSVVGNNISLKDILLNGGKVYNWAGFRGAYIAEKMMNRWFGISCFFLLFFMGSLGVQLMRLCRMSLIKRFLLCSVMLIWSSLFFSFVFIRGYEDTFLFLGGGHGYYLSETLTNNIGKPGVILVLLVSFLVIAICLNKNTIPFLQHLFSFSWVRKKRENGKIVTKITIPEEMEDYDDEDDDNDPDERTKQSNPLIPTIQQTTTIKNKNDEEIIFTVDVPVDDNEPYDVLTMGKYDPRLDLSNYRFPTIDLLQKYSQHETPLNMEEQADNQRRIKLTLEEFGINITSIKATVGPTVTLYEVVPAFGVRIAKIRSLEDDIALKLSALGIRIIAPMPGKGTIGIEVPNKEPQIVSMQSIIVSRKFIESMYELPIALGRTITNEIFMFDLSESPHILIAGATGQGKSVGLNAIITSLLYKKHPAELKFVLVDPKMVEFSIYNEIEHHYLAKLPDENKAIITDYSKVVYTLNSLCVEMENRYELLMKANNVRKIKEYNEKFISRQLNPEKGHKFMPYLVLIIDEFADLIMTAGKEIEKPITRIAQKGRAVGIHMIIATQRPSANIITGTIKANFPVRIAFRVITMIDSRTILDTPGANQLVGRGDLLFYKGSDMIRVQCAFIDGPEVERIVAFIGQQPGYSTAYQLPEYIPEGEGDKSSGSVNLSELDPLFDEAARLIVSQQQGSTSLIQRRFEVGYNRAGRLMDQLEKAGIVGPPEGSKPRQVLIPDEYTLDIKFVSLKK